MGYIKKYSYLRALFIGVPFGISCFIGGIMLFIEIPEDVSKLNMYKGEIISYGMKDIYDKEAREDFNVFYVDVQDKEFYTELGRNIDILKRDLPILFKRSKNIIVWCEEDSFYIEQLQIGENLLIEYTPPYWMAHFFLWLGVITLASALIYVIKHPEDLTGKKKK